MNFKLVNRGFRFVVRGFKTMSFPETPAKASICCEEVEGAPPTYSMYEALKDSCQNNAQYFQPDESENGQRLYQGFMTLIDHIDTVWPLVDGVRKVAPTYDFDEKSPGNGYRSFVSVVDSCILHGLKLSRQVCTGRDALLFRKGYFVKEVESCSQLLASLGTCLHHLHTLISWAQPGDLFPSESHSPEELFSQAETINQYCFYGRCLGFQFAPSIRGILKGISICMAGFSEAYYSQGNLISSVWTGGQYLIDPELRARRIVNISQSASVEFCKAFWFLTESEIMRRVPSLMSTTVAVNKLITITPLPQVVMTSEGKEKTIVPPNTHIGLHDLNVRIISVNKRNGMTGETSSLPASPGVLFHCHGGGFVAQSSRSHEGYLREWAARLDVPIVSVDYSLAPQAPFPRALEEVFFAYCWLLNNFKEIGSTGKRIVFAGDSAGANLLAGCILKILEHDIRVPDGLFMAYAPLLVSFTPSPSRLLCLMDPLLPFGFMMRCLKAYASPKQKGKEEKRTKKELTSSNVTTPLDGNGFLKVSNSREGLSSCPSSFEEVSPSDLAELQAQRSGSRRASAASADTTASAASLRTDHDAGVSPTEDKSQQYVSDFLDRYVFDSDTDSEGRRFPVVKPSQPSIREAESEDSATLVGEPPLIIDGDGKERKKEIKSRISEAATGIMGAMSSRLAHMTDSNSISGPSQEELAERSKMESLLARSPSDEFMFSVPRDPHLSPYYADESLLARFPPLRILTVHLDPCLDDCVMFAKKLKRLGNEVEINVLEGLPHGFLNLALMDKHANDASLQCIDKIKYLLDLENAVERDGL